MHFHVLPPSTSAVGLISGIAPSRNHSQLESVWCLVCGWLLAGRYI
ncbi:hypothetical protein HMPREF0454_03939 [Hafnia alvei ATCC 51873]|uniref:Uncharacterized protein n=1 Tax=Hafnia alvei ATCC 51873 TaxID=1002364 RepID=G9YBF8_HAFAL|nr:hypothetical protein HMPREF0454_03939 [Hafnia alvei ATCC 51873]